MCLIIDGKLRITFLKIRVFKSLQRSTMIYHLLYYCLILLRLSANWMHLLVSLL
jgi:hypothetical protein